MCPPKSFFCLLRQSYFRGRNVCWQSFLSCCGFLKKKPANSGRLNVPQQSEDTYEYCSTVKSSHSNAGSDGAIGRRVSNRSKCQPLLNFRASVPEDKEQKERHLPRELGKKKEQAQLDHHPQYPKPATAQWSHPPSIQISQRDEVERVHSVTGYRAVCKVLRPYFYCQKMNASSGSQSRHRSADPEPCFLIRIFNFVF